MNTFKFRNPLLALLILLAVGTIANIGCRKELLDAYPDNLLAEGLTFETPDRFVSMLNGVYARAKGGNFLGSRYLIFNEVRGGDFINDTGNGVTGLETWRHNLVESTNEVNYIWEAGYLAINAANIYIEGAQANARVLNDDVLLNSYVAEARFIRALCYHNLLQLYARPYADGNGSKLGLPLRIQAERGAKNNDLKRSTVAEVTNLILDDLNFAETNLLATQPVATNNKIRAHKNAAIALKVRVLLGKQDYAGALAEANKIVPAAAPFAAASGVAHALAADVKTVFGGSSGTNETIFSVPFTANNLPGTQNALGYYWNPTPRGNGEYSMNPTGILGNPAFEAADTRRGVVLTHTNNKPYCNKYAAGPQSTDFAQILRYSEVLLAAAEAEAEVSGVSQRAVDLLNAVRTRSAGTAYDIAAFATKDDLINAILIERNIEFFGEGLATYDITRRLRDFSAKGTVLAVPASSTVYIWPIPFSELATNKLCERN